MIFIIFLQIILFLHFLLKFVTIYLVINFMNIVIKVNEDEKKKIIDYYKDKLRDKTPP